MLPYHAEHFDIDNQKADKLPDHIAPEFFLDPTRVSPKIDLYSLGIAVIHATAGQSYYSSMSKKISGERLLESLNEMYDNVLRDPLCHIVSSDITLE